MPGNSWSLRHQGINTGKKSVSEYACTVDVLLDKNENLSQCFQKMIKKINNITVMLKLFQIFLLLTA